MIPQQMAPRRFIVNPTSRGGEARAQWPQIVRLMGQPPAAGEVRVTTYPREAEAIAAASHGVTMLIAVGGDGTVGEVLSGILHGPLPRPRLAIVPTGTGNDVARQVGIPSVECALAALERGTARRHDVLQVDYTDADGPATRYGFIYAAAGFSANRQVSPWMKRWLHRGIAYHLGALRALLAYHAPVMQIESGGQRFEGPVWVAAAANTEWAGGASMRIAPGAQTDDGLLNISIIRARSRLDAALRLLPRVARGTHVTQSGVDYFTGDSLLVSSSPDITVEVDGDVLGSTPMRVTLLPGAVEILSPPP